MTDPQCKFYQRTPAEGHDSIVSSYCYDPIHLPSPGMDGYLTTPHPPLVGDLISLYDPHTKVGGVYRVVDRSWIHSSWGSANWPYGEPRPQVGPLLDIIVERADGPFRDEAPTDDDEGEAMPGLIPDE